MKKQKIFAVSIVIIIVSITIIVSLKIFSFNYQIVNEGITEESYRGIIERSNANNIVITPKKAAKIADCLVGDKTTRRYKVFYDKNNDTYIVCSKYKTIWFDFNISEAECNVVIDCSNGTIEAVDYAIYYVPSWLQKIAKFS